VLRLQGHLDTITGMRVSPDGAYLLTNAMDCTLRIWDLRPYAPPGKGSTVQYREYSGVQLTLVQV